jgi:hypothetical protein
VQPAPQPGKPRVELEQHVVSDGAEHAYPRIVLGDLVELVAVDQQVTPPIGRDVLVVALDADVAEQSPDVLARRLVVIAGHEHHMHVMPGALEDLLHYGVLRR